MNALLCILGLLPVVALHSDPMVPKRLTKVVAKLDRIDLQQRVSVARNPQAKTPSQLNLQIPQIDCLEVSNEITDAMLGEKVKVFAWNLERGRHWRAAGSLVETHAALKDPAIIFLSEMDLGVSRTNNEHTTAALADRLGMNYAYAVEFLELTQGSSAEVERELARSNYGYHGNAILARAPLANVRALRFPGIESWYGSEEHRLGGRIALFAEIEVAGSPVTLVCTHLESGAFDNAVRGRQMKWILEEIAEHAAGQPVILGGDLNSPPLFPAVRHLEAAGFDVSSCNLLSESTTQRVVDGRIVRRGLHLDYLALRNLSVVRSEHSPAIILSAYPDETGESLSDHAIVVCEVRIKD